MTQRGQFRMAFDTWLKADQLMLSTIASTLVEGISESECANYLRNAGYAST